MGSYSFLSIEALTLDWGKNENFPNHSCLYLPTDKTNEGYARCLGRMVPRLELMGFTLKNIKSSFEKLKIDYADDSSKINNVRFEDYYRALSRVDLNTASSGWEHYPKDSFMSNYGEFLVALAFQFEDFNKLIPLKDDNSGLDLEFTFLSKLDSYSHLRILAENSNNHKCLVAWRYSNVVEAGYVKEDDIYKNCISQTLIVTEGSSDSFVIKESFKLLKPYVKDFFYFVDMGEGYPFSGTGNLINFIKGLSAIKVLNNILVIFDNDYEGSRSYNECMKLAIPDNMKVIKLPELPMFNRFPCVGPMGETVEDINGRAVSIECFLDFKFNSNLPKVRWTNDGCQGSLEKKEKYVKSFKNFKKDEYDFSKVRILIEEIIKKCIN